MSTYQLHREQNLFIFFSFQIFFHFSFSMINLNASSVNFLPDSKPCFLFTQLKYVFLASMSATQIRHPSMFAQKALLKGASSVKSILLYIDIKLVFTSFLGSIREIRTRNQMQNFVCQMTYTNQTLSRVYYCC